MSHDNSIRFWHAGYLFEEDDDDGEEEEKGNEDVAHKGKSRKGAGGEECVCTPAWEAFYATVSVPSCAAYTCRVIDRNLERAT